MQQSTPPDRWTVIVPLKSSKRGKSRIDVDPALRRRLALAMAMDTVAAASAADGVDGVLVVVEDPDDGDRLSEITGVRIVVTTTTGLNEAIRDGLNVLARNPQRLNAAASGTDRPVAVLPGDLASLTADELDGALLGARAHRLAVVADKQGTGSTLLTAAPGWHLRPHYGAGSLRLHVAAGAVPIELPVGSGLRRDVDQAADLVGVTGVRTVEVLASAGLAPSLCTARPTG